MNRDLIDFYNNRIVRGSRLNGSGRRRRRGGYANTWTEYVKEYYNAHPNLTYAQAMQKAAPSYHRLMGQGGINAGRRKRRVVRKRAGVRAAGIPAGRRKRRAGVLAAGRRRKMGSKTMKRRHVKRMGGKRRKSKRLTKSDVKILQKILSR